VAELEKLIDLAKAGDVAGVRAAVARQPALASQRLPSGESPITAALYRGHHAIVDALVELGAEVDVFAAAATGRLADLERALKDSSAVSSFAYDGWTPLHLAAFFGQLDAARMLLDAGADVHIVSRNGLKNTPLHAAAAGKHEAVALLLLGAGGDPQAVDAGGYSALRIASENGLDKVVRAARTERPGEAASE
jgi:ankyrin repeat protein